MNLALEKDTDVFKGVTLVAAFFCLGQAGTDSGLFLYSWLSYQTTKIGLGSYWCMNSTKSLKSLFSSLQICWHAL